MSTTITEAFTRQYETDVKDVFQREGAYLRQTVRFEDGVVGYSTTFNKIGKGVATTKSRHGAITPMNQTHTAIECTLADFYAGDWVDKLDEAKIKINEQQALVRGGAYALGRKVDDQIVTVLDATTQVAVTWTITSINTIENSLISMVEALHGNDVPNDGQIYGLLTPRSWAAAMKVESFSSADYVGPAGQTFVMGISIGVRFKPWMGVMWQMHTGLPGKGTAAAKNFVYHKTAIGYAAAAAAGNIAGNPTVSADITWHGDRASHFVNNFMSGGAALIDDTGVIEGAMDDTVALPAS
jgi:hypothetical protein